MLAPRFLTKPFTTGGLVNKAELIEAIAERADLKKADATKAVEALFDGNGIIVGALKGGQKVQVTGFGTFQAKDRAARKGRDPRTGAEIQIKAATVPSFKAGQVFKDALNS
jgi:DNA-binding protein HU-beta